MFRNRLAVGASFIHGRRMSSTPPIISREVHLVSRPRGLPTAANFDLAQVELTPPQDGQVQVRNIFMSVDPYMRGRMIDRKSYVPPFELGQVMEGGAVGEIVESHTSDFQKGDIVVSNLGWRGYFN